MTKPDPAKPVRTIVFTAVAMMGFACNSVANARPPAMQNSPGYDRALKESRENYLRAASPQPAQPTLVKKKKAKPKPRSSPTPKS